MPCTGRYASAWSFALFWCVGSIITGTDDAGGAANAFLTDSQVNFVESGVLPNVGMVLYNLTSDLDGPVTAVTEHTLTATGVTWDDGDSYRIVTIDRLEIARIEHYLDVASSDIHAALAASGACDCTLADWATRANGYLEKLNIIDAAAYFTCSCLSPEFSDDQRRAFLEWASNELANIRMGKIELCSGATGSEFPAAGWAEMAGTEFGVRDIVWNSIEREL